VSFRHLYFTFHFHSSRPVRSFLCVFLFCVVLLFFSFFYSSFHFSLLFFIFFFSFFFFFFFINMFNFFGGPGGPGGPSGMPGMDAGPREPVDTTKYYELLGLEKSCTNQQIKKAFRQKAREAHPDKGGDPEVFKQISEAYEVLKDAEKRELYDKYGAEGVRDGARGGGPGGMDDLFSQMFGMRGGGSGRERNQKKRGEDVVFPLKVTLEDLYNGTTKKLRLTRNVICKGCDGKGGDKVDTCGQCHGSGVVVKIRQLGPGMIQQMQSYCPSCKGEGRTIQEDAKCGDCTGRGTVKEKKTLEVFVNKGMKSGQRVVFNGEADEAPNTVPGDVVVVLQQKEHDTFRREGPHLFVKKKISLLQALCGFKFIVTHLDGRHLLVQSKPGEVYKPGDVKAVRDEGMPQHKNPFVRGNLYIEFDVEFPKPNSIAENTRKLLAKILPESEIKDMDMDANHTDADGHGPEECHLEDVDIDVERQRFAQQQREAYDEDDEDHHRQSCRQA
jgi:DnaJ homolog subfamily A member 2